MFKLFLCLSSREKNSNLIYKELTLSSKALKPPRAPLNGRGTLVGQAVCVLCVNVEPKASKSAELRRAEVGQEPCSLSFMAWLGETQSP